MNRMLKTLGLALCAAFALSVVSASAASAETIHHITSDKTSGFTHLTAKAEGPQTFYGVTGEEENKVVCEEVNVRNATIENGATEITAEPVYGNEEYNCEAVIGESSVAARVKTNGCHYTFYGNTTEDVTGNQSAPVDLTCDTEGAGPGITIQVINGLNLPCITVPAQELEGVTYKEDAENEHALTLEAKIHGIHSTTEGVCRIEGEPVTHTDGLYEGNVTVTGWKDEAHTETADLGLLTTEE